MSETQDEYKVDGGPAFPRACGQCGSDVQGMSLLDHFAGLAMMGIIHAYLNHVPSEKVISKMAYDLAAAMLDEREKRGKS